MTNPLLLFYVHIPLELVQERVEQSRGETRDLFEDLESLKRAKRIFDGMDFPYLRRIDGSQAEENVFQEIYSAALGILRPNGVDIST